MIKCVKMYSNNYRGVHFVEKHIQQLIIQTLEFSCRLYGLRKYKKQIKENKEIEEEISNRNTANTTTTE